MHTTDELIQELTKTFGKTKVAQLKLLLSEQSFDIDRLIDLTFHPDKTLGFRAMWLLDAVMIGDPERYAAHLPYFLSRVKEVNNESCKRHYARIMMFMTMPAAPQAVKDILKDTDLEDTVEQFFDWMIDPKVKVAVKVFAADALCNLSTRYDWIPGELVNQIKFMMRDGGPAIQSRGKVLLKRLEG